jgi:cytochrome P450
MNHPFSDVLQFRHDPLEVMLRRGDESGEMLTRLRLGPKPVWLVTDPNVTREILRAPEEDIDKGRFIYKLRQVLGVSSLSMSGPEHRRRREVLHSTFARGAVDQYAPQMAAVIRNTIAKLVQEPDFDAHWVTSRLSLRLVSLAMFGPGVLSPADEQIIVDSVSLVEDDLADELFRIMPLWPWQKRARKRNRAFANAAMTEVVKRVRQKAPSDSAVGALEALHLTDEEMRNEILTMILAGYHTTGNAAAWLLYHLATVEGLAKEIAAEAAEVVDDSGDVIASKLQSAPRSLAFVKETLRLYPSSHWFSRDAKQSVNIHGIPLKAGDAILIAPWFFHRSSRFWKNPDAFDLDRDFSTRAYLPFGAGPRVCVGMGIVMLELQLIALEFASCCHLHVLSEVPAPPPKPAITLVPPAIRMMLKVA